MEPVAEEISPRQQFILWVHRPPQTDHSALPDVSQFLSSCPSGKCGDAYSNPQGHPTLHPTDFFLGLLSLLDACYVSVITSPILATLTTSQMVISYGRCAAQFFFFTDFTISFTVHSLCLLVGMAYGRFVTVSDPLS